MTSERDQRAALDAARSALAARDFQRAHRLCIALLQQDPRCAEALFLIGVIAAEHDNFTKAVEVSRYLYVIEGGHIRYHGTAAELKSRPEVLHSAYLRRESAVGGGEAV